MTYAERVLLVVFLMFVVTWARNVDIPIFSILMVISGALFVVLPSWLKDR